MSEDKQINPRISPETWNRLNKDAEVKGISTNINAANILEEYYHNSHTKKLRGDITLMRSIQREMLRDFPDKESIEQSARNSALQILSEIRLQIDNITSKEMMKRMKEWHENNKFNISFFDNNERMKIVVKYDLGKKWTHYMSLMYFQIFKEIGETVLSHQCDDMSFSIEFAKHSD